MTLIRAEKGRKLIRDITITDANSNTVTAGTNDVVRIKIGRRGQTPILDLDSAAASTNGSTVTKNSPSSGKNRVAIVEADMNLLDPGVYTLEVALYDNADSALKHVDHQIFHVAETMLGDVGSS